MQGSKYITLLGATGSIGTSTLDVIRNNPKSFRLFAATAFTRVENLYAIAMEFFPEMLVVSDEHGKQQLTEMLSRQDKYKPTILAGEQGLSVVASHESADTVVSAIVGGAGLVPTMDAIKASKCVLLANKESLVMSGDIFMRAVEKHNATLIPVDSEHNAIFQALPSNYSRNYPEKFGVSHLLLTASGGPFRTLPIEQLSAVTPAQACAHPNWDMGRKISVDSASMMNKGLEFIEAFWLFGIAPDRIKVVIHPQSIVHSMVQYIDGSVIAQLGNPDMRTPIAHALAFPSRIPSGVSELNVFEMNDLSFSSPCETRFPNLYLAIEACKRGQAATTALNAANEVAVDAFLNEQIQFLDIYKVNKAVTDHFSSNQLETIKEVLNHDQRCRDMAKTAIQQIQND